VAPGGLASTQTNVTVPASIANSHGQQTTKLDGTLKMPPAGACPSKERLRVTLTVRISARVTRLAFVVAAQTADGAGPRMTLPGGNLQRPCAVANLTILSTTSAATALMRTTVSAVLTARAATGPGLQMILSSGTQMMPAADVRPQISKRLSLEAIVASDPR